MLERTDPVANLDPPHLADGASRPGRDPQVPLAEVERRPCPGEDVGVHGISPAPARGPGSAAPTRPATGPCPAGSRSRRSSVRAWSSVLLPGPDR
ncbi:hypothetical protein [Ornithinimicrobium kibberense]|uniref:hypothetical protein n=1 Tax=Ornithinimicrobium kibberense TaxID=282060 RepID=UPI00361E34B5